MEDRSSTRDGGDRKDESRRDRDREKAKERNGERHREKGRDRDRDSDRRSERVRERSSNDKSRHSERKRSVDEDEDKRRDSERRRSERERSSSVQIRRPERERSHEDEKIRRAERDGSADVVHRDKQRYRKKDREAIQVMEIDGEGAEKEERAREKEKDRAREEAEREREKEELEKEEERVKEKEKDRAREKEEREKERSREREKREKEKREREREREARKRGERQREKTREREEKEREREARKREERERERERASERDEDDDDRDHDRKRRRREGSRDRDWSSRHREASEDFRREGSRDRSNRHRETSEDRRKPQEEETEEERERKGKTREEDLEEEQRKLDEEMDKRRRRVQEWQELRRKEEQEREKAGAVDGDGQPKSSKNWTLDGESDDDDAALVKSDTDMAVDDDKSEVNPADDDAMKVDSENNNEDEVDPLDAYMDSILPEVEKLASNATEVVPSSEDTKANSVKKAPKDSLSNGNQAKKGGKNSQGEDSDSDYSDHENDEASLEDEADEEFLKRVKKTKVEKLALVDHSKIQYPPFRKNFYIEVKEIMKMTSEEVGAYRKQLELKIHGKDVPKPVKTWNQTGLASKILDTIKKMGFEKPMPIQAQALPVIMSGRDCIAIGKTGSGKTLAFVLPMLRHIKDQPPLVAGDGPIGLIMAPTRELVQQIHSDIKKFSKVLGITCVPVYGGSGVAQQISDLKRGAEIVVCTPGRMIDILCTSSGKITNLRRVTYLVMDEADRMFDMGFESQITGMVQNTRPDRQTVLFSATFPHQVEILARKVLNKPIEIQVGGRSAVNKDIAQLVEVRPESERFLRLLELLGEWYEKGKILVFVQSQDKCDSLFKELLKNGYPCLSLHGAKDQMDRGSTITDFKSNVCNLLIATSIAARGLDVKELELVVNFDAPNHYEDYVHRVGRTGRAGRKGCAVTFISEDDARYAPNLVKALELSGQAVPEDLKALADGFMAKVNQGTEQAHGTGYGGSGFKFNDEEDEARKAARKAQAREYGFEEDKSDSDSDDEGIWKAGGEQVAAIAAAARTDVTSTPVVAGTAPLLTTTGLSSVITGGAATISLGQANALAAAKNLHHNLAKITSETMPEHYEAELEINDFPQNARWKITHKETSSLILEWTGAAITPKGRYYPPGTIPASGERKLYLRIQGPSESSVKKAKAELKRVLEDLYIAQAFPGAGTTDRGMGTYRS